MTGSEAGPVGLRLDKWLWFARFFKTRTLAAREVTQGHVRVNAVRVSKPSRTIVPGDVLTFPQAKAIRVVRIVELGQRRGPAPEAQALYEDLSPPAPARDPDTISRGRRPTKKDRRRLDAVRDDPLE